MAEHRAPTRDEYLRLKASTLAVWRCRRRYDLAYVKCGSRVLYDERDLIAFLERRKKQAGAQ